MSSGSFENLIYDTGAYCVDLKQSTAPLKWRLDPVYANNCNACRPADVGYIGRQGTSVTHQIPLIDVDSDMKLLNYRNTRDPSQKYIPHCYYCKRIMEGYPCGDGITTCKDCRAKMYHFPSCSISTEYSRLVNPPCNIRGTGVNRFQPLCLDPQDLNRWEYPGEVGINSRMFFLDNHVPCIPQLKSQTAVLPKSEQDMNGGGMYLEKECARYDYGSPLYHSYYAMKMGGCPDITYV